MVTVRTPLARKQKGKITPEAIALFRRAEALRPTYSRCIQYDRCKSRNPGRHCEECREYLATYKRLARALGISWFDISPLDAKTRRVPDHISRNGRSAEYVKAWELRSVLAAEAEIVRDEQRPRPPT
jgi:hypothetical protein